MTSVMAEASRARFPAWHGRKFWLKVLLFVTVPLWLPVFVAFVFVGMPLVLMWEMVSEMVDGPLENWDGPW